MRSSSRLYSEDQREKFVRTLVRYFHTAFNPPYVHDYIIKLCKQQADVIQNNENKYVPSVGQGGARHIYYKRLKLGGGQAYGRSRD
jgi:hypothetical protein